MAWRLGIDLGTNSLGWWAFSVEKDGSRWRVSDSLDGGVYIFPDGREPAKKGRVGDSNAVERRRARSLRRNRDRRKARLRALLRELVELGLMPESRDKRDKLFQTRAKGEEDCSNPYRLRAEAVERSLAPYELGRVLFHLGLRRGFKSNRLEQADNEGGKLKEGMDALRNLLNGKTLGQFQWTRFQAEKKRQKGSGQKPSGIRFRGEGKFYPDRAMYATEFDKIRKKQEPHHSLKPDDWKRLRNRYVLFQWPLKPVERGSCEFFIEEHRYWRDTPIGHDFRIYQELNMLRWVDADHQEHPLSAEQRSAVLQLLLTRRKEVKFDALRKQKCRDRTPLFPDCIRFNLEGEKRKGLKSHTIGAKLAASPHLVALWERRCSAGGDEGVLDDIFKALHEEDDTDELRLRLAEMGLADEAIHELTSWTLSRVTASVSRRFMEAIVPIMREQELLYWEAVKEVKDGNGNPLNHSQQPGTGNLDILPYYGEVLRGSTLGADPTADPQTSPEQHFGKINNPTVHVALNSLRRVVNTLIGRFGERPVEIHVELSRALKRTRKERDEDAAHQDRNQKENNRIREELSKLGVAQSTRNIKKFKLWEELGKDTLARRCPFSGKPISCAQLFNGEAEIEHILPFRRTLDDSMANLTVAMRWANRLKGNQTPYEAFASNTHAAHGIEWEGVRARAHRLPDNKKWRFGPDAMVRFEGEHGFIARQLMDNAYIARASMRYLHCLKDVEQIVPNRGGLTALLRRKWGFLKDRADHRHHAIDAAVIGLADWAMLNSVSKQTARNVDGRMRIIVPKLPEQIEQAIHARVPEIVVAFKPDHGWQGAIFKDSAYGFIPPEQHDPDLPEHNLVVRKSLTELTRKECGCIRDKRLRSSVGAYLTQAVENGEDLQKEAILKKVLARFGVENGIGKVRILVTNQTVKPVPSAPYKGYKPDSYVCCDVWRCPKGKAGKWRHEQYEYRGVYWSYMDTPNGVPAPHARKPHPAAKLVARFYKNDMVAYEEGGPTQVMRVAGFSTTNNKLDVVPHSAADPKQNFVALNKLGAGGLRKLRVSPDGRIRGLTR